MPVKRTAMETLDIWTEFALEAYWKRVVEESILVHAFEEASGITEDSETGEN
jgi:hypothetical protein